MGLFVVESDVGEGHQVQLVLLGLSEDDRHTHYVQSLDGDIL